MSSAPIGRYPQLFTRQHLEPIETHRATILDRDEHTCLADGVRVTSRYWATTLPCTSDLVVTSAAPAALPDPIYLRTFCRNHAALSRGQGRAMRLYFTSNGWRIPDHVDPLAYAAMLPVRAGDTWWVLDTWGERRPLTDTWAAALRTAMQKRWAS